MILIDPPLWPAHGTVFSHLVSDSSLAELHEFAAAAGVTGRAFDLDHYDVPERIYSELVAAGARPVSGKDLVRALASSGLRVKARHRSKAVGTALQYRWDSILPGHAATGEELLGRWNESHRHYHSGTHLLAVLEALDLLTDGNPARPVVLAAWFHDAVYNGVAGVDEEESATLAQVRLKNLVPPEEASEVARLVRLTANHSPAETDRAGALLCDADLAVLGGSPDEHARYLAGVREDYAHIPQHDFDKGRAAVVRQLLALEPLFHTMRGRELWAAQAQSNLTTELARLIQNMAEEGPLMDYSTLPIAEFAFPGPLRDQLVAAILDGTKTSTTGTAREYEVEQEEVPKPGDREVVVDSAGKPVAVIEVTEVRRARLADVDLQHATDEGEGFATVAQWRAGHEDYWHSDDMRAALNDPGFTVDENTMLVLQRFRLIERLA